MKLTLSGRPDPDAGKQNRVRGGEPTGSDRHARGVINTTRFHEHGLGKCACSAGCRDKLAIFHGRSALGRRRVQWIASWQYLLRVTLCPEVLGSVPLSDGVSGDSLKL